MFDFNYPICERCGKETKSFTMSMFSEEYICMECKEKERQHPDYQRARDAEHEAVKNGNMNFSGIGKPADL